MPEVRYYTVTQEREVKVSANSAIDAARIANAAFESAKDENPKSSLAGVWGNITTNIRVRDIVVREDY